MIGKAKIVDDDQRLQMVDELFALLFLPQERVLFVERPEQFAFFQKLSQVVSQKLLLERKTHESSRHADLGFHLGQLVNAS